MRSAIIACLLLAGCAYNLTVVDYSYDRPRTAPEEIQSDLHACELQIYAAWRAGLAASGIVLISTPPPPEIMARAIPEAMPKCMEAKGYRPTRL